MLQLICLHKSECRQWMISSRLCRQMSLVSPGRYNSPRQQQQQCKHCHIPLTVHHYCSPRLIYSWWSVVRQLHLLWLNINCLHYFDEFSRCWHHHTPPATEAAVDLISPSRTSRSRGCWWNQQQYGSVTASTLLTTNYLLWNTQWHNYHLYKCHHNNIFAKQWSIRTWW